MSLFFRFSLTILLVTSIISCKISRDSSPTPVPGERIEQGGEERKPSVNGDGYSGSGELLRKLNLDREKITASVSALRVNADPFDLGLPLDCANETDIDPVVCQTLAGMGSAERDEVVQFLRTAAVLNRIESLAVSVALKIAGELIYVDGHPVDARTRPADEAPIEFYGPSVELMSYSRRLMLFVHEIIHKVEPHSSELLCDRVAAALITHWIRRTQDGESCRGSVTVHAGLVKGTPGNMQPAQYPDIPIPVDYLPNGGAVEHYITATAQLPNGQAYPLSSGPIHIICQEGKLKLSPEGDVEFEVRGYFPRPEDGWGILAVYWDLPWSSVKVREHCADPDAMVYRGGQWRCE